MVPTPSTPYIAILTGPTACGKTALAIQIARQAAQRGSKLQLINADSLQMIRGFTIGTAKPSRQELAQAPHQLLDVFDPDQPCTAGDFVRLARQCIQENDQNGVRSLIVGGTGFYIKALLTELWPAGPSETLEYHPDDFDRFVKLDPDTAYKVGPNDHYRIKRSLQIMQSTGKKISELAFTPAADLDRFRLFVLDRDPEDLDQRIVARTDQMLRDGLIDESMHLLKEYPDARALDSVGYKQVVQHLRGEKPEGRKLKAGMEGLRDEILLATRQLVKSQRTWMRGQYKQIPHVNYRLPADEQRCLSELETLYGLS